MPAAASTNLTPAANIASRTSRSSTKRILAPNGQPRKIPMAMNLDDGEAVQQHLLPACAQPVISPSCWV